jgi:hypothetical protein
MRSSVLRRHTAQCTVGGEASGFTFAQKCSTFSRYQLLVALLQIMWAILTNKSK